MTRCQAKALLRQKCCNSINFHLKRWKALHGDYLCLARQKRIPYSPHDVMISHFQPRTRQPWLAQPDHWRPPDSLISTWSVVYQAAWKKEIKRMILSKTVLHSPGCNLLPLSPADLQPDTKICFCLLFIRAEWREQVQRVALELKIKAYQFSIIPCLIKRKKRNKSIEW